MAPDDLKKIGGIDFVDLNLTDKDYWKVGLSKIIDKAVDAGALRRGVQPSMTSPSLRRAASLVSVLSRGPRRSVAELSSPDSAGGDGGRAEGDTTALVAVVPDSSIATELSGV